MRPASEIHTALESLRAETERQGQDAHAGLIAARDTLAWVVGERLPWDGPTDWLCAFLLDDPPRVQDVPPEAN